MRVLHLSASRHRTAAARAAAALDEALRAAGVHSRLCAADDPGQRAPRKTALATDTTFGIVQQFEFDENRAHPLASRFTLGHPGAEWPALMADADVIHLHGVKGVLTPAAIHRLLANGRPVVWTLDDAWAFTGGCHNPADCARFADGCHGCPQLREDRCGLPAALVADKRAMFGADNLVLVATSAWLAESAARSMVFAGRHAEVLPAFAPHGAEMDKAAARRALELDPDMPTVVFLCEDNGSPALGRERIGRVLDEARLFAPFARLAKQGRLQIIALGNSGEIFRAAEIPVIPVASTRDRILSPVALAAADFAVAAAPDDITPALFAETLAHGLPVVAADAGGASRLIQHGHTGRLVPPWEMRRLAEEFALLLADADMLAQLRANCLAAGRALSSPAAAGRCTEFYRRFHSGALAAPRTAITLGAPGGDEPRTEFRAACSADLGRAFSCWPERFRAAAEHDRAVAEKMKSLVAATDEKLAVIGRKLAGMKDRATGALAGDIAASALTMKKLRRKIASGLARCDGAAPDPVQAGGTPALLRLNATQRHFLPDDFRTRLRNRLAHALARRLAPGAPDMDALFQHAPVAMRPEHFPRPRRTETQLPSIAIVTPSFMQGRFIERTVLSVLDQHYPRLRYAVQDAASTDETPAILRRHQDRLASWTSEPDTGQARAIEAGFHKVSGDVMAWLNSDDVLMPGALRFVGEFFAGHPDVDAIYGHRVIIDEDDREVGRWVLPRHDPETVRWIDYVPQETLFWRAPLLKKAGGIDPKFRFAIDWDLLLRFQNVGARIVRVPYFLGCFRVHSRQKTSADIGTVGKEEIAYLRWRENGGDDHAREIGLVRKLERNRSAVCRWLLDKGIRW